MAENKLELAWAAGFFDGEGSTYVDSSLQGNHYYPRLRLGVVQSGETFNPPQVLVRFQKAVGDIGSINPIPRRRSNEKPAWQFKCQASVAEQVLDLLWPFLSDVKKSQAQEARNFLRAYKEISLWPKK